MANPNPNKWTLREFDQCVALVEKARRLGVYENVLSRVKRMEAGHHSEFMASGLADGDLAGIDFMESARVDGAMTDAAKRRGDTLEDSPAPKTVMSKASPYASPYASPSGGIPPPMPLYGGTSVEMHMSPLPPGIASVHQWGEYLVSFGKYAKKKKYVEILTGTADEFVSYRKYLLSHYNAGSAQLRDLVDYMKACGYHGESDDRLCIPGTHIARVVG